jgi:hypothetical protein
MMSGLIYGITFSMLEAMRGKIGDLSGSVPGGLGF